MIGHIGITSEEPWTVIPFLAHEAIEVYQIAYNIIYQAAARHFLEEDRIIELLSHQPDHNEEDTRAFVRQVVAHDYNPPKRERILQWQSRQDFPICPTPDEPGTCNVYQELRFPDRIYDHINDFWEEQTEAEAKQRDDGE